MRGQSASALLEATTRLRYPDAMRQFLWGMAFGALAVWVWLNYQGQFYAFQRSTLSWRDWAVSQTGGYSAGKDRTPKR
jgi:hypothetical protein